MVVYLSYSLIKFSLSVWTEHFIEEGFIHFEDLLVSLKVFFINEVRDSILTIITFLGRFSIITAWMVSIKLAGISCAFSSFHKSCIEGPLEGVYSILWTASTLLILIHQAHSLLNRTILRSLMCLVIIVSREVCFEARCCLNCGDTFTFSFYSTLCRLKCNWLLHHHSKIRIFYCLIRVYNNHSFALASIKVQHDCPLWHCIKDAWLSYLWV